MRTIGSLIFTKNPSFFLGFTKKFVDNFQKRFKIYTRGKKKLAKIFKYTLEMIQNIPKFFLDFFFGSYERKKKKKHCKEPEAVVL